MKETNPQKALQAFRERFDRQSDAAHALQISLPYFNDMLHGRRDVSPSILRKLGLRRAVVKETK
jgi:hypothetical protein